MERVGNEERKLKRCDGGVRRRDPQHVCVEKSSEENLWFEQSEGVTHDGDAKQTQIKQVWTRSAYILSSLVCAMYRSLQ